MDRRQMISRRGFLEDGGSTLGAAAVVGPTLWTPRPGGPSRTDAELEQERTWVGRPVGELPTPALIIELDAFERNLARMQQHFAAHPHGYRPHGKAHKSPIIGAKQIAHGARGQCAGKLGEAEVLAAGGLDDILITSEVVGVGKIERLMKLAAERRVLQVVDHPRNVEDLARAAAAAGLTLSVLVDVNVGQNRTGVLPGQPAVELAQEVARHRSLRLRGIQGYGGHIMHIDGYANRLAAQQKAMALVGETRAALERAGFDIDVVSVGGTGTYRIDTDFPWVTECQPGSYIFMDSHYSSIGGPDGAAYNDFANSLFVISTVISAPDKARRIVDAGQKILSNDAGPGRVHDITGVDYRSGGDEHGILTLNAPSRAIELGDRLTLVPSHCDTTVNLHDRFFAVRKGVVEAVWPVAARGMST
jgi:D-serine deaminase-like pyridoxal phosphate-dependent protein